MCAKGHLIVGTNITCEGKTSQLWALFWKRFMPKRNFLHKKGFFCIKGLSNVTFYACKMSFNCRYQSHANEKLVNCRHCFEKGSCPKENFLHKKGFFAYKGCPMLLSVCAKGHSIVGTNITREKKTSQLWALFWKRFMPKRNFLHKKGFFYIKGLPNITFYACKRLLNWRY